MNINEAIEHCKEISCSNNPNFGKLTACQNEHAQLAEWLEELVTKRQKLTELHQHILDLLDCDADEMIDAIYKLAKECQEDEE